MEKQRKKQYIQLFSFMLGIAFIVSSVVFVFGNTYRRDREERVKEDSKIAEEIAKDYKVFFDKAKELNTYREELEAEIDTNTTYYANLSKMYHDMTEKFDNYEKYVAEIEEISSPLNEKCEKTYSVMSANDKCHQYYIYMEKSINLLISDVKYFNAKVEEYNEWIIEQNKSEYLIDKYEHYDAYSLKKYTEYVDLNDDDIYLEKDRY